ncbi:MAG: hypothetical protein WA664_02910 [Candidatus Acidiferrales bacterium]
MAHSYLVFDFGNDEETAQQARHKIEAWKQGFRLGNKLLLKFERAEIEPKENGPARQTAARKKSSAKEEKSGADSHVRLLVRLDFSDHEKLSQQRWLDRIPTEDPFKSVDCEIIRQPDAEFEQTAELFESLD